MAKQRTVVNAERDLTDRELPAARPVNAPHAALGLQRRAGNAAVTQLLASRSGGTALPATLRRRAESAFGRDFGGVRIHDDPASRDAVAALDATAATRGPDIHLGPGAPDLGSPPGERLLWHELTHVVQQSGGSPTGLLSTPGDAHERQADAVASGAVPATAVAAGPAPAVQRQNLQTVTPNLPPRPPPGMFGPPTLSGPAQVGPATLPQATYVEPVADVELVGEAEIVAGEGGVTVGGTRVAGMAVRLGRTGGIVLRGAAQVGVRALSRLPYAVVGAVVVTGVVYVVVKAQGFTAGPTQAGEEYPGTSLPGGAPPMVEAPGATGTGPVEAPGAPNQGPVQAPGAATPSVVHAPGAPTTGPVRAPGVIDSPDECLRLIKAGTMHDHHIFPREFQKEFRKIGILVDRYTVTMEWDKHIGRGGVHNALNWNLEWQDFFLDLPDKLTPEDRMTWKYNAFDLATELMSMGKLLRKPIHHYRKPNRPAPVAPPHPPTGRRR